MNDNKDLKKAKKEIVKMLLNNNMNIDNEEELMEILFDNNIAVDVEKLDETTQTVGDKAADGFTKFAGSWFFIISFVIFLVLWMILNITAFKNVDPYPFILLNLILSCVAALQAPVIMMSQNRQAKKDSLRSHNDYKTDLKSELILEQLHHQMSDIAKTQKKILTILQNEDND